MKYVKTAFDLALAVIGVNLLAYCNGRPTPVDAGDIALALAVGALLRINAGKVAP